MEQVTKLVERKGVYVVSAIIIALSLTRTIYDATDNEKAICKAADLVNTTNTTLLSEATINPFRTSMDCISVVLGVLLGGVGRIYNSMASKQKKLLKTVTQERDIAITEGGAFSVDEHGRIISTPLNDERNENPDSNAPNIYAPAEVPLEPPVLNAADTEVYNASATVDAIEVIPRQLSTVFYTPTVLPMRPETPSEYVV